MLNITFPEPAELLKPIELIREPVLGKDTLWLVAGSGARSHRTIPLSVPVPRVSVAGRAHHPLGDSAGKGACPPSQGHLLVWLRAGKQRGQLTPVQQGWFPPISFC